VGGIYFPVLSLGVDEYRPRRQLLAWGFAPTDRIFGMNFPELPLSSEYCRAPQMRAVVLNRLGAVRRGGFRHAFIVNVHGGTGQADTLRDVARRASSPDFAVELICPLQFNRVRCRRLLTVGGHAGLSETMIALAFRPDLVDLTAVPAGELTVRRSGILHERPVIEERWHPRHADRAIARRVRESIVTNVVRHVRKLVLGAQREARAANLRAA
jgi:creatinine amidohydrolase/Fe(II)-dependent formamide hydrolase-like protein